MQKLITLEPDLCIQTKSDLVLRDIDLIKQFESRRVGFTITTLDDNLRREIEPFASAVENRIKALEKLRGNGIPTYVFIGPILPFLTDWKKIVLATKHCADYYMFKNLNVAGELWKCTENWLKNNHPDLLDDYKNIYFSENKFWDKTEEEIEQFCKEQNIECGIYFHHKK